MNRRADNSLDAIAAKPASLFCPAGQMNGLVRQTKGCSKSVRTPENPLPLTFLERFAPYIPA